MNHNLNVIRRHRNPLLGLNLIILGATLLSATVLADMFAPPVWKAKAQFNVPTTGGNLSADLGTLGSIRDSSIGFSREVNPLQIQSTIMTSNAVIDKALAKDPERENFSLGSFKSLFSVEPLPQSTVINIEARGSNSDLAATRAQNLASAYQERLNELRYEDANFRQEFNQQEFQEARNNLQQAQEELAQFRRTTGIIDPNTQSQQLVGSIDELKTRLTLLKSEAEGGQVKAEIAANYFNTTPGKAIQLLNLAENPEFQEARQKLTQTETELSEARSQYQDSSPQVQNLLFKREQLTQELKQKIGRVVPGVAPQELELTLGNSGTNKRLDLIAESIASQANSQGLQRQTVQIQSQIDKLTEELNSISGNRAKLAELERKHDIAEGVYKGMVAQSNRAKIDNFNSYPNVQLIDGPIIDPEPETPSKKLILFGGLMASLFGSASLVLFLESASPLLSPKDLMALEFPVLFSVAHLKQPYLNWNTTHKLKQDDKTSAAPTLLNPSASSYVSSVEDLSLYEDSKALDRWEDNNATEREFERLATIFSSLTLENRRVMITSATAGEGKTTITLGLAIALRKLGYRILVVDGDLQKSSLSKHLGIDPAECKADCVEVSFPNNADYELDLMPAPAIPKAETARFFAKGKFERALDRLQAEENYDYVLVDTPPVSLTNEAMLMAPIIDNVLFVVKPGTSDRHPTIDSLEQLKLHKAQIKGVILNAVDSSGNGYRYEYYPQTQAALPAEAPQTVGNL